MSYRLRLFSPFRLPHKALFVSQRPYSPKQIHPINNTAHPPLTRSLPSLRAHWYTRQVHRSLLDFDCAGHLCGDAAITQRQREALIVGCMAAGKWPAVELLALLPISERVAVVTELISRRRRRQGMDAPRSSNSAFEHDDYFYNGKTSKEADEMEAELVAIVLRDPSVTPQAAYALLQAVGVPCKGTANVQSSLPNQTTMTSTPLWLAAALGCALRGHTGSPSQTAAVLSVCEQWAMPRHVLARCCVEAGLHLEATAYQSPLGSTPLDFTDPHCLGEMGMQRLDACNDGTGPAPRALVCTGDAECDTVQQGRKCKGFGSSVAALLPMLRGPNAMKALNDMESLRQEMSPAVSAYTRHRVALTLTRREWDSSHSEEEKEEEDLSALRYMASTIHTTPVKEPETTSGNGITTAAKQLHLKMGLGTAATAAALLPLYRWSWERTAQLMQHTQRAGVHVALDALYAAMTAVPDGRYYVLLHPRKGHASTLFEVIYCEEEMAALRAHEVGQDREAEKGESVRDTQKPERNKEGEVKGLLGVAGALGRAAVCGSFPNASLLRAALDAAAEDVARIGSPWAPKCTQQSPIASSSSSCTSTSSLSPCLYSNSALPVTRGGKAATVLRAVKPLEPRTHASGTSSHVTQETEEDTRVGVEPCGFDPIPITLLSLRRRLLRAPHADAMCTGPSHPHTTHFGAHTELDVFAVWPARRRTVWWSSLRQTHLMSPAKSIVKRAAFGLWRVALHDLTWRGEMVRTKSNTSTVSMRNSRNHTTEVHAVARFVAFAADSGVSILRAAKAAISHGNETQTIMTLACMAGALNARGRWEDTLRLLPADGKELPPLLQAVRLRALRGSGVYKEHVDMLLEAEQPIKKAMPYAVQRLVKAAKMKEAFKWWR